MNWIVRNLWLIPVLPTLAAAIIAVLRRGARKPAAALAIASLSLSLLLSLSAFAHTLHYAARGQTREIVNFPWLQLGAEWLRLGWMLDPLGAVMLVMVSLVGLLIFVYSAGYMVRDDNFTRFFCFMSLFAGAMLGLVIANSLLLLFMCWELVGLTSYLLIGFWYYKPSAAAAAKKAFITTRIGDLALLLGMVWLFAESGTLLFYDRGAGCLENASIARIAGPSLAGWTILMGISLLIFLGAMGKSGQVPLHVWLPDAMEGPTPVSALIHAATMVAAGVFLVARVFPLMQPDWAALANTQTLMGAPPLGATVVVTWVGAITAVFAASIALAQTDIKRILAYSTVSQLGYMMMGLGVGGVAVGLFHLITHAFFKALLFLGAGSVIHGCNEEQDIRRLGGLRRFMPVTFATYAIGTLALCGFPLLFSGFWSKDAILHSAHGWTISQAPFYLGLVGALLTAFYMSRQVFYVFFGANRLNPNPEPRNANQATPATPHASRFAPAESPHSITVPLVVLSSFSILLGFVGTPAWPWFQGYLDNRAVSIEFGRLFEPGIVGLMLVSSVVVLIGLGLGWWFYGRKPAQLATESDPLERLPADVYTILRNRYWVDEIYEHSVVAASAWWGRACDWLDRWIWGGLAQMIAWLVLGVSWVNRLIDEYVVDVAFDEGCRRLRAGGRVFSRIQSGRVQTYLRILGLALVVLVLLLVWGCAR